MSGHPYPPTRAVAVDIDGTLIDGNGHLNTGVVDWLRARKTVGFELILWSARGVNYARFVVFKCGLEGLFDAIISKPGYILDDGGWNWIKYTRVVRDLAGDPGEI